MAIDTSSPYNKSHCRSRTRGGEKGGGLVRFSDLLVSTSMEKPRRPKLTHGPEQALDIGASGPRVSVRLGSKLTCRYVSMGIPSEAGSGGR